MNGNLVKQRLFELGLSKEEFAVKMQCSVATVFNMLAGRRVSERNLFRASKILGLSPEQLERSETRRRKPA